MRKVVSPDGTTIALSDITVTTAHTLPAGAKQRVPSVRDRFASGVRDRRRRRSVLDLVDGRALTGTALTDMPGEAIIAVHTDGDACEGGRF